MPLLNDFLLGADPEFVVIEAGHVQRFAQPVPRYSPWGLDHASFVIEPHPKPDCSVRQLVQNLKTAMNDFATIAPAGKWRAGAFLAAPERTITLGGHVHVDQPHCTGPQLDALDLFTQHLEALDILPKTECVARRNNGHYGLYSDIRAEHGHFEYRTFPSWLFSQRVTKICLTGTKLAVVDPDGPKEVLGKVATTSLNRLKTFFERFQAKDDDANWLLSSKMLDKKLVIDPDKDLRSVWNVEPMKEDPHWKLAQANLQPRTTVVGWAPQTDNLTRILSQQIQGLIHRWRIPRDYEMTRESFTILREFVLTNRPQAGEFLTITPPGPRQVTVEYLGPTT
jgi:hypothetical protein